MRAGEGVAAALGALLVLVLTQNVLRQLVIPRARRGRLQRLVDGGVDAAFHLAVHRMRDYADRDRLLAAQAPATLLALMLVWLAGYLVGYALLLWPWVSSLPAALREAGSSMFTLGFASTAGARPTAVDFLAAATGLAVVALLIAYLPTLYGAFNRRETEVTLLGARAGSPPWGPELLARTRYGVTRDDLPAFYAQWERWAADVAESHTNYPVLVRFRSPDPLHSWVVALLAVLDSAAMLLALSPEQEVIQARLCLRMGFSCLRAVARALDLPVEDDPRPDDPIELRYEDFLVGVARVREVGFPVQRSTEEAWAHFRGWRVNYEAVAYALTFRTDAVPSPWSGPRRDGGGAISPRRPANRTPERPEGLAKKAPAGGGPAAGG